MTGDAALFLDNQDAFNNAFVVVGIATVVLIIGLLLFIYRSPVAAFLPIITVGLVTAIAPGLIALAAKAFDLQVTQDLQIILTVVLYGVGTDYILFLLFRYRERLRAGERAEAGPGHRDRPGRRGDRVRRGRDRGRVQRAAAGRLRRRSRASARAWRSPSW